MAGSERPNGHERQDPLANTKRIVDLVFRLPVDPSRSEQVLDAVGTVYADLRVLDERRRLDRQLARGLRTEDVDLAIANVHEAASLRPVDDVATEQRMIVLAGLERIRQATIFNENVGQHAQNGIAIVQVGITSRHVEAAITDVQEAKVLIEQSQPLTPYGSQTQEPEQISPITSEVADNKSKQDPVISEPIQDIVDVAPPLIQEEPHEDIVDRVDTSRPNLQIPPSTFSRIPRVSRRRALLSGAGALALGLTWGYLADPENHVEPTEADRKAADEQYIREHSLTEEPIVDNRGWYVAYPQLEEGEVFEDIFKGNFRQLYRGVDVIPIYTLQGENTPLAKENWNTVGMNMRADISKSDFRDPLPIIQVADNTFRGHLHPAWSAQPTVVVSGRKIPESTEQREFPFVVQFSKAMTKETHYLQLKPIPNVGRDGKPLYSHLGSHIIEITYMKKNKKS